MALRFVSSQDLPEEGAIIVCAGTVTCRNVSHMGAGFSVFKKYFHDDIAYDSNENSWQTVLNHRLYDFFHAKQPMPAFQLIAKSERYLGGVATVPYLSGNVGLDPSRPSPTSTELDEDYLSAVKGAVETALKLKRPLYLQPLGIGVYGWTGEKGGVLFAKGIKACDPNNSLSISIPLFRMEPGSNDQLFKKALESAFL